MKVFQCFLYSLAPKYISDREFSLWLKTLKKRLIAFLNLFFEIYLKFAIFSLFLLKKKFLLTLKKVKTFLLSFVAFKILSYRKLENVQYFVVDYNNANKGFLIFISIYSHFSL